MRTTTTCDAQLLFLFVFIKVNNPRCLFSLFFGSESFSLCRSFQNPQLFNFIFTSLNPLRSLVFICKMKNLSVLIPQTSFSLSWVNLIARPIVPLIFRSFSSYTIRLSWQDFGGCPQGPQPPTGDQPVGGALEVPPHHQHHRLCPGAHRWIQRWVGAIRRCTGFQFPVLSSRVLTPSVMSSVFS